MKKSHTALITGAALRLGRSMALSLADAGWDIVVHYHLSAKEAQQLADLIGRKQRKAYLVRADLRDAKAVARIIPSLAKKGVIPDCLVNNAALFKKDTLATLNAAQWQEHMQTNMLAPLLLMRDFAAHYKGAAGNIINITDGLTGWSMSPGFLSYALSKQGLEHATQMLAREFAPRIRVNAIAPGATLEGKQEKPDTFAKLRRIIPLNRTGSPEELNLALQFILASPSLTGQILSLSGGM